MTYQTLYMNQIVLPQLSTFVGDRRSSFIYLKGIKLSSNICNLNNYPIILHMAILQDRDNNNSDLDRRQNFFRDTTSITARAHPFTDWVNPTSYDYRQSMNPINSDHYNVITHSIKVLGGKDSSLNNQRPWYALRKKYYKINRRIAFDNATDEVNWRPFYVAHWWQPINRGDYSDTVASSAVWINYKTDVVFKNIL